MGLPRGTSAGRGFADEVAVVQQFELPDPMGLETVRPQDALHPIDADAGRLCNGNAGAMRVSLNEASAALPRRVNFEMTRIRGSTRILAAIFTRLARDLASIFRMT